VIRRPSGTGKRGRGRPARSEAESGPGARERILEAARSEFADRGYDKTSVRGIATAANVDPALVHHYFGTKDEVFAAAIEVALEPATDAAQAFQAMEGARDGSAVGEQLARYFFGIWEDEAIRTPLLAVMRSALTNETAATALRSFVTRRILARVADGVDVPDPELRTELAAAQLVGAAILRYVVRAEPLASADVEEIIATVAPTIQRYLTQP
jgi:AcrR family transcriptional regulator